MPRKCGICGTPGHTRRTCPTTKSFEELLGDKQQVSKSVKKQIDPDPDPGKPKIVVKKISYENKPEDGHYAIQIFNRRYRRDIRYRRPDDFDEFDFDVGDFITVSYPWNDKDMDLLIELIDYVKKNVWLRDIVTQKSHGLNYGSMERYNVVVRPRGQKKKKRRRKRREKSSNSNN